MDVLWRWRHHDSLMKEASPAGLRCIHSRSDNSTLQHPAPAQPFVDRPARMRAPAQTHSSRRPMPKRTDLQSILILGSGPIVIGQATELSLLGDGCSARGGASSVQQHLVQW